ncbi:Pentalenene oxygenase [Pseudovibrio sp. W64]|uniref:cytochrome P450 n=1 Tax=Pseudovibrio TaxID=258255 RepID=UPI0007AEDDAB|nr:cytochrome P450 [Pseudovibrio sp. W64]KZK81514.1 Pentalenene oxygenase [Pseudovibrio sp. W64]
MTLQAAPIFNASSEMFQNIGLLKVSEFATRQCGDKVQIHASDTRELYLLAGADSVTYWRSHQGHFRADFGDLASNDAITLMLVGNLPQEEKWRTVWLNISRRLNALSSDLDEWLADAGIQASHQLVTDALKSGSVVDLRDLCREWAVRAVFPALLGFSLVDVEIADGLDHIENFYLSVGQMGPEAIANYESLEEYRLARTFLDDLLRSALETTNFEDDTLIAKLIEVIPDDVAPEDRLGLLRPALANVLTEKLNVGGRSLMWVLSHLAQAPDLVTEIAEEDAQLPRASNSLAIAAAKEGMRLYPELPFIYRITSQDVLIGDVTVPKYATVIFSPWLVHRDQRYWDDPAAFNVHRYNEDLPDQNHYFPFGVGPRIRARARFFLNRLSTAVAIISKELQFSLAPDCPRGNLRPLLRSALVPRGAVKVAFSPREKTSQKSKT